MQVPKRGEEARVAQARLPVSFYHESVTHILRRKGSKPRRGGVLSKGNRFRERG